MTKNKNINNYKYWEISQDSMDVYASFILNKLEVLTPKQKEVIILTLLEGKTPKEISELMQISLGRVHILYKYSIVRLRRVYEIHKKNYFNID